MTLTATELALRYAARAGKARRGQTRREFEAKARMCQKFATEPNLVLTAIRDRAERNAQREESRRGA